MTADASPSDPENPRPNPVSFAGSLIYWLEVPSDQQHYIQGILEGYDDLGYYQTIVHGHREDADGRSLALARITSTVEARAEIEALIAALAGEYGIRLAESAPEIPPDAQPPSRKVGRAALEDS